MKKIFLINNKEIPHYRVPVYSYLREYLLRFEYDLTVISEGIQKGNTHFVGFPYKTHKLNFGYLRRLFVRDRPEAVIFWMNFEFFKFPVLVLAKMLRIKIIYWGHGRDLEDPKNPIKNAIYFFEYWMDDAIILYADHLRRYISRHFHSKTFIANNTLNMTIFNPVRQDREEVKKKYGIVAPKNIICMGRMQRRKRIGDLYRAFQALELEGVGLILAGPDNEGVLKEIDGQNVYKVGAVYGEESLDLLAAADVCCLPGHVGLSIVDAFYCGLPMITERGLHAPEIMYLKEGINGFIVPSGDIGELTNKLRTLLTDKKSRHEFSLAARKEIMTNGHIDKLCKGFESALQHVFK